MSEDAANALNKVELWTEFQRVTKAEDDPNARIVYGLVSDTSVDVDKQKCDPTWLRKSLTKWFNEWGNIRAMHQPIAAGSAISLVEEDPDKWYLTSRIVDQESVAKLDAGVYKGYSINVAWPKLRRDPSGEALMGIIAGGEIVETSLVDRPANSAAKIALLKAAGVEGDEEAPVWMQIRNAWVDGNMKAVRFLMKAAKGDGPNNECDACSCADCDHEGCDCCEQCDGADEETGEETGSAEKAAGDNGRRSPPKGYPKNKSQYAGPDSYSFPVDSAKRTRAAIAYYNAGKGKENHSDSEWASIGSRIVTAANKFFGGGYSLDAGKVTKKEKSVEKLAATQAAVNTHFSRLELQKGKVNPEQVDVAEMLNLGEMEDSQIALVAANLVRTLMIRELHEQYEPDEPMSMVLGNLAGIYDSLMSIAKEEYEEAFSYQAQAIVSQLMTGHDMDQAIVDAQGGIAKIGAALNSENRAAIAAAHDSLAKCMKGADCNAYMKATKLAAPLGAVLLPPEDDEMSDEDKNKTGEQEETVVETPNAEKVADSTKLTPEAENLLKMVRTEFQTQMDAMAVEREALKTEVEELRNRAADGGPLVTSVAKSITQSARATKLAGMKEKASELRKSALSHTDPVLRSDAFMRYVRMRSEISDFETQSED